MVNTSVKQLLPVEVLSKGAVRKHRRERLWMLLHV